MSSEVEGLVECGEGIRVVVSILVVNVSQNPERCLLSIFSIREPYHRVVLGLLLRGVWMSASRRKSKVRIGLDLRSVIAGMSVVHLWRRCCMEVEKSRTTHSAEARTGGLRLAQR